MFMNLDDNEMSVVIDAMDHQIVAPGEFIIKEKDLGEELYIVECGQFACTKIIDGKDTFLKNYN